MPDINQPFVAISGLAVGLTATSVITDTGSLPLAVSSFNGLTGAVTGVTTSVANTFTAIQTFNSGISASTVQASGLGTFNAGISASGATFMGNINLQNAEFIRNTTNGRIDFMPAPSAANAYGMYMDFTGWGFGTKLGTIRSSDNATNVAGFLWDSALVTGNDVDFSFGANQAYKIRTTATNNNYKTLQLGLPAGTVGYSSALAIMDYAQAGSSLRQPNTVHTHPNVYIYSAGNASANDFIRIEHDRTNANIITGQTSGILIQPGSGFVGISGGISASGGVTFASKVNAIQGVVSGYPRLEWCGLTSGFDIIPTGWQNVSAPISTSPTANDAYFAPIFISSRIRIVGIGHQTGTASSGNTGSFILGLYDSDNFGYPRNRLYASAQTALSTSNFASQRITGVNTTVNPGQYWLAITFSAAGLTTTGLGRLGTRMKFMTPTSGSPIGQASVDGLRRPQGGFTLAATQGTTFANVEGPDNPCIFYNGEFI